MSEIWKDIPFFEGLYQVSTLGRIKSLERCIWIEPSKTGRSKGYHRLYEEKIINPTKRHHLDVTLYKDKKSYQLTLHTLILLTFVGKRPDGFYGCHKDDDILNNNLENLYWGTPKQNSEDKIKNGNQAYGTDTNSVKLNYKKVKEIRKLGNTISQKEISELYEISQSQVSRILSEKHWKYIE